MGAHLLSTRLWRGAPGGDPHPGRRFGPCTRRPRRLAHWLIDGGMTTVALESTGVSWMPLFALLEARGFQGLLLDPRQAPRGPGRPKTARLACQWLQRWQTYGLLAGAFGPRPTWACCAALSRHRQLRLTAAAHPRQPRHKVLAQMHRKRPQGVRDLTGVTGRAILTALLAGERAPQRLAQLRTPHGPHAEEDIAKALQGPWRAAPLLAFQQAMALSACYHPQMPQGEQQRQAPLATVDDQRAGRPLPPKARRPKKRHDPRFEARPPLSRLAGVALTTIEGIADGTAWVILPTFKESG